MADGSSRSDHILFAPSAYGQIFLLQFCILSVVGTLPHMRGEIWLGIMYGAPRLTDGYL